VPKLAPPVAPVQPVAAAPKRPDPVVKVVAHTGDAVRSLGDGLSATVQKVGDGLAPLAPPLAGTVQDVAKLLAFLLQNATHVVAGVLDAVLPHGSASH
jgi:hypothetical protein